MFVLKELKAGKCNEDKIILLGNEYSYLKKKHKAFNHYNRCFTLTGKSKKDVIGVLVSLQKVIQITKGRYELGVFGEEKFIKLN